MFRLLSDDEYETLAAGGVRQLFRIDHWGFQDALDDEGVLHHCLIEFAAGDVEAASYVADQPTMYEFLARYLAGEYEKKEYRLARSPAHETLLDLLEEAAARARSGQSDFAIEELVEDDESLEFEDGGEEEER